MITLNINIAMPDLVKSLAKGKRFIKPKTRGEALKEALNKPKDEYIKIDQPRPVGGSI